MVMATSTYLTNFPVVLKEFHPEKNTGITSSQVTVGSRTKIWWRCQLGHEWQATPNARLGRRDKGVIQGCPYCSGRLASPENNLLVCYPEIAAELDEQKTGKRAEEITPYSDKDAWWICSEGHSYSSRVANRTKLGTGCKYCGSAKGGPRAVSDQYNLAIDHPDIASKWHPTKNGDLKPTEVSSGSKQVVWWSCESGCEWDAQINGRTDGKGCPYCSGNKVGFGNDLKTISPDVASEWDYEKNHPKRPEHFVNGSNKRAWWVCSKGHGWDAVIGSRTGNGRGCPLCTNQSSRAEIRLLTELQTLFGGVQSRLKIQGKEADLFIGEMNLVLEYDGAHWHRDKEQKDNEKSEFFEALGMSVVRVREKPLPLITKSCVSVEDNIFEDKSEVNKVVRHLISEKFNSISSEKMSLLQKYMMQNNFENEAGYNKYLSYFPSPFPEHSLDERFPEVAEEWHPTKNAPLTPRHFTAKTDSVVWWLCKHGHEWEAPIANRTPSGTRKGSRCPYCSGRLPTESTSLQSTHPDIADEWHPVLNGDVMPSDVKAGSKIERWWLCPVGHTYKNTPNQRKHNKKRSNGRGDGCPVCAGRKLKYDVPRFDNDIVMNKNFSK